jgi:hypothetical protein
MNKKKSFAIPIISSLLIILLCSLSAIQFAQADNTNLISVPSSFTGMTNPGIGNPQYPCDVYDTNVLYNGQGTIRVDCANAPVINVGYGNFLDPECDYQYPIIPVSPGDHIVFYAWIETGAATVNEPGISGAVIDTDIFGTNEERICGCQSPSGDTWTSANGWPSDWGANVIPFGTSTWTYVCMNYYVQSSYQADGFGGFDDGAFHTPGYICPCLFVYAAQGEGASAWFDGLVLYKNPSSSSASISLSPTSGAIGTSVTISGSGFADSSALTATFNGSMVWTGTSTYSGVVPSGATFNVPTVSASAYTVTVTDASSNSASAILNVTQYSPIDFFHEGKVDSRDFFYFMNAYVQYNANGIYNPACDLNHDGKIDAEDFFLFLNYYIQYCAISSD